METHPFEGSYGASCIRPGCYAAPAAEVHHYVPEGWCQWDQEDHDYPAEGECRRCGAEQPYEDDGWRGWQPGDDEQEDED